MPIDLSPLIAPLEGASPCGEDLLFSSDFDAIQHARRFDDPSLDQGEWITEIKEADWGFVIERCSMLLKTQTKDLRLAAWLSEALAMKQGVVGLSQGYVLLSALAERYWDSVHPLPEGDDTEYRLGNVSWLVGRTAQLLREVPLTQSSGGEFSGLDWEVATHVAQAVRRDPDHADELSRGKPSLEQIEAAKRATPPAFYKTLLTDLKGFEAAMQALEQALDARAGNAAPSFRQAKEAYEVVFGLAERFGRDVGAKIEPTPAQPQPGAGSAERAEPSFKTAPSLETTMPANTAALAPVRPVPVGPIQTRADAVAQLRAVARFFRATEPHSPAAYLADKAAEWADMPLHEWLATVVKDDGSLAHVRELLGVKPGEAS
ncbi:type VI secretion system protein TssA [Trinickia dinghuensis]|uniref:Type VI secretion system protein TssA n=1 Tax=Trinickia dinghuensis TaxID=2291023 RepID=A0A3D8JPV3_9BURK|nr:type VI secretion system protein TssA [Trinickia dinghuensis]RDU95048.1 type VI secretion system protein TssA [Trinickia dinghuensis]